MNGLERDPLDLLPPGAEKVERPERSFKSQSQFKNPFDYLPGGAEKYEPPIPRAPVTEQPEETSPAVPLLPSHPQTTRPQLTIAPPKQMPGGLPPVTPAVSAPTQQTPVIAPVTTPPTSPQLSPQPSILDRAAALKEELYHQFNHTFPPQEESVLGRFLKGFVKAPPLPSPNPGQTVPMDVFSRTTPPPEYRPPEPQPELKEESLGMGPYAAPFKALAGAGTVGGQLRPTLRQAVTPQGFQPFYETPGEKPLVDFSQFAPKDQPLIKGVADVLSSLTVPNLQNAALWSSGPLLKMATGPIGRAIAAGFSIDMLRGMPEQGAAFRKALDEGRLDDAERMIGQMMAHGGLAGFLGARAQFGGKQLGTMIQEAKSSAAVKRSGLNPEVMGTRPGNWDPLTGAYIPEPIVQPPAGRRLLRGSQDIPLTPEGAEPRVVPHETKAPPVTSEPSQLSELRKVIEEREAQRSRQSSQEFSRQNAEELVEARTHAEQLESGDTVVDEHGDTWRVSGRVKNGVDHRILTMLDENGEDTAATTMLLSDAGIGTIFKAQKISPKSKPTLPSGGLEREPIVERPAPPATRTEVRPPSPPARVEEPVVEPPEERPSTIWGAPKKAVSEILGRDPQAAHEISRRADAYLEDWPNLALGKKGTTYFREGGEGRITGRVSELEGGERHPSEVAGIREVYSTDGYQRVVQALKEQKGPTWNKIKFQAERMAAEDHLADQLLTDDDLQKIIDQVGGAHDEIAYREAIREAVLEKLSPAPELTEADLNFQRVVPFPGPAKTRYRMLTKRGTFSDFQAKNDAEALQRFREEGGRELRQRQEGTYHLGRLIGYKDAAGNENLANIQFQRKAKQEGPGLFEEPAVTRPGHTRLYRGEGTEKVALPEWAKTNAGEWFTTSKAKAERFKVERGGVIRSIDVPNELLEYYKAPSGNTPDEYLIPKVAQENFVKRQAEPLVKAPNKKQTELERFNREAAEAQERGKQEALGELTRKGQGKVQRRMAEVEGPLFGNERPKKQGGLFEEQKVTAPAHPSLVDESPNEVEYVPSTSTDEADPDRLFINRPVMNAMTEAFPEHFSKGISLGFHVGPHERQILAGMVKKSVNLNERLPQKIVQELARGLYDVDPKRQKSAVVKVIGERAPEEEEQTEIHEVLHAKQLAVVKKPGEMLRGARIYELLNLNRWLNHPLAPDILNRLTSRGYQAHQVPIETMAHIGAGQYEDLGLDKEQAADLYVHSLDIALDEHGEKALKLAHGLHPSIQEPVEANRATRRAAEREHPPAPSAPAIQRGIERPHQAGTLQTLGKAGKPELPLQFQINDQDEAYAQLARVRIEMPELVELAEAINEGKIPGLREQLGKALGRFVMREGLMGKLGEIQLKRDIFIGQVLTSERSKTGSNKDFKDFQERVKTDSGIDPAELHFARDYDKKKQEHVFKAYRKDPTLAPKVLAHEIGHLIDWIGDSKEPETHQITDRGNILGRIASLHNYLKNTLQSNLGGPLKGGLGVLTGEDSARLRRLAEQLMRKDAEIEIDEEILTHTPFTPEDILKIWKATISEAGGIDKTLYRYIAGLDRAAKKQIMREALKGIVPGPPSFPDFPQKTTTVKTGKRIHKRETPGTPEEIAKKYRELILEEIRKRQLLDRDTITEELKAVTRYWHPFNDRKDSDYTKYRYSGKELYADAFSVLLNDPGELHHLAPNFWRGIMNYMERKPDVKQAYDSLQARSGGGGGGGKIPPRLSRIAEMFDESKDKRDALNQRRSGEVKDALHWLTRELIERNAAALRPIRVAEKAGGLLAEAGQQARHDLEEIPYVASEAANYLYQITSQVRNPSKQAGLSDKDVGTYLFLRRVVEERQLMGNPLGFTPKTAQDTLDGMKEQIGSEKFGKLEVLAKKFREIRERYIIPRAEASGMYTPALIELMKSNKVYARFSVSKWLDQQYGSGVSAKVFKQVGTLSKIENPLVVTALQDMAVLRAAKLNESKRSLLDVLELTLNSGLEPAEMRWSSDAGRMVPKEPKNPKQTLFVTMNQGKPEFHYIPKDIAEAYERKPFEATQITKVWTAMMQPIRAALVSMNPVWMARNIPRDFFSSAIKLPEVKTPADVKDLLKAYNQAFREGWKMAVRGEWSSDVQRMMEKRMMLPGRAFGVKEQNFENELERLGAEFELDTGEHEEAKGARAKLVKFAEALQLIGRVSEVSGKIAGYKFLTERATRSEPEVGSLVRSRVGTPDIKRQGSAQALTNNLFLFSNVNKEGWRSSYDAFREDPASYVWKAVGLNVLPKLLLYGGAIGIMGEVTRRIIKGISEYDKSQYTTVPLGATKEGKSIYLRIPGDYESQFWGALAWKLAHAELLGKGGALNQVIEQVPWTPTKVNPYFSVAWDLAQYYGFGNNPTDTYRGIGVIRDKAFEAGGWEATKDMGKHVWRELGGSVLYDPARNELQRVEGTAEKALKTFPMTILGTFAKVSDQGISETIEGVARVERQKQAARTLEVQKRIDQAINKNGGARTAIGPLYFDLKKEGNLSPEVSLREFAQRYSARAARATEEPYVRKVIEANTIAERRSLLAEYQKTLSPEEYDRIIQKILATHALSQKSIQNSRPRSAPYQEPQVQRP